MQSFILDVDHYQGLMYTGGLTRVQATPYESVPVIKPKVA